MTLLRPMIQFRYKEEWDNNIDDIRQFATFFDSEAKVSIDEEYPHTLIIDSKSNMSSQRLWNEDYLIYDNEGEATFSTGTTSDSHGWSIIE